MRDAGPRGRRCKAHAPMHMFGASAASMAQIFQTETPVKAQCNLMQPVACVSLTPLAPAKA